MMRRRSSARACSLLTALALVASCGGGGGGVNLDRPVRYDPNEPIPERLSDLNLFAWDGQTFTYNERVVPYDLNTPLFTDYALKDRAIYVPDGATIGFDATQVLDFPVGTLIIKNFYLPADLRAPTENITLVETRILALTDDGWEAWPYIWDEAQRDAVLSPAGDVRSISFVGVDGETRVSNYLIPQRNQCQSCHLRQESASSGNEIVPIGPRARNMNRDHDYGGADGPVNQLSHLASLGMLTGLAPLDEVDAAFDFRVIEENGHEGLDNETLNTAARDYLDINCAHCHSPTGVQGVTSQLFLNVENDDDFRLGYCKRPGSAGTGNGGRTYDIVPGDPDESILIFRVETEQVGAMMPLLGRSLEHSEGSGLLRAWVASLDPDDCGG